MYFKHRFTTMKIQPAILAVMYWFAPQCSIADTDTATLTVEPGRCIALQQGQTCYANVSLSWTTPIDGEYCVFDDRQTAPILCWNGNSVTSYRVAFESNKNVRYEIRNKSDNQLMAQALVKISWVYKSNTSSTSRWRLF